MKVMAQRFSAHLKRDILLLSKHEECLPQLCSHISEDDWPCFCSISLCISLLFSFPLHIKRNFLRRLEIEREDLKLIANHSGRHACLYKQHMYSFKGVLVLFSHGCRSFWNHRANTTGIFYEYPEMTKETCPPLHNPYL